MPPWCIIYREVALVSKGSGVSNAFRYRLQSLPVQGCGCSGCKLPQTLSAVLPKSGRLSNLWQRRMDPVSLTSLGLQTLQLAIQSGLALHQFVRETRNVNATVRELAFEIKSLGNACRVVHEQLQILAGQYELQENGENEQAPISASIQKELESCQKTLNTLRSSLVDVRGKTSNFVKQGWRQFKLNMKQDEIVAIKSRVQSHTSALQVCLLVMDINVSHLAPKRVGNELKAKLDELGLEMQRLQGLLREHCEKVDGMIGSGSAMTLSMAGAVEDDAEVTSVWSESVVSEDVHTDQGPHWQQEGGARSILVCAQDTLSRATSLYEESLYEPSLASTALSRTCQSSQRRGSQVSDGADQVKLAELSEASTVTMPLNLPTTLQLGYQKLQEHLRKHQRASSPRRSFAVGMPCHSLVGDEAKTESAKNFHDDRIREKARQTVFQTLKDRSEESSPSSLSYLKHIEEELHSLDLEAVWESRRDSLEEVLLAESGMPCKNRVALTGRMGIGKTYVAAAVVQLTMHNAPKMPVFWISANELEQDCQEIADRLGLKRPAAGTSPWDWLCKVLRRLSGSIVGPWLVVIDGVGARVREHEIEKLASTDIGSCGHVLLTTRMRGYAEAFAKGGLVLTVDGFDSVYAANLLGQDSATPISGAFDAVAFFVNFEPHAILRIRKFLRDTGMDIESFAAQLSILTDEASWHEQGLATTTARRLTRKVPPTTSTSSDQTQDSSSLLPVIRCCLHPLWPLVFEELDRRAPSASELLGALSAIGRSDLASEFLLANSARRTACAILVEDSFLAPQSGAFYADRMMLLAHRVWLLDCDALSAAYAKALRMVACDYPEGSRDAEWSRCRAFEPLAMAVISPMANSWTGESNTTRWFRSMLLQKRSRFFRDSGTNKWEGDELEAAEVLELQLIHAKELEKGRGPT